MPTAINEKKHRAVLFDLDGVLISSFIFWFHLFNNTLRGFGHKPINLAAFKKHWGQSTEEDIRIFMPERTLSEVKQSFFRGLNRFSRYLKVNRQAHVTLAQLRKKGFKLACVTNSHRRIALWQLRTSKLRGFFTAVVTADDVRKAKPHPAMLLAVCKKLNVSPAKAFFIGDTKTDAQAARHAGCIFIGYRIPGKNSIHDLQKLIFFINNYLIHSKEE